MDITLNTKKDLVKLLDSVLLPCAFTRLKDDWYLDKQDCVLVVGLGKSLYGGQFSIAIAFLLKDLSPELLPYPPYHLCHFRQHSQFIVHNWDELKAALNLENELSAEYRGNKIKSAVTEIILPTLLTLCTKFIIAHEITTNKEFEPYCDLDLKVFLQQQGYLSEKDLKLDLS